MSLPTIGVVIATPGRRSLLRTLNSIQNQGLLPRDDILVVGDGYHEPTEQLVALFGPPFRYVATEKTRDWGHSQQNWGLKHVKGDWMTMQDDDDIFLPRAFDEMRTIISKLESPRPLIGRVMTPYLGILWREPGSEPLDGHCIVVPNDKAKLGYLSLEYAGDQTWLKTNLDAYETYSWADRIWSLTRPTGKLWAKLSRKREAGSVAWDFYRDDDGMWQPLPFANLSMWRKGEEDHWHATAAISRPATEAEMREIAEYAAWAGQGSDVWFHAAAPDTGLLAALNETGYQMHQIDAHLAEFIFEWPPHKFEPPTKEGS